MTRTYLVSMPLAEAHHLAGTGYTWSASPQARLTVALHEWLTGLQERQPDTVPVKKAVDDPGLILDRVSADGPVPVCGPFGPGRADPPPPGRAEYLGVGIVRLDEDAISSLASLDPADDFHITHTDAGPVLSVGADTYLAREEEPDTKH